MLRLMKYAVAVCCLVSGLAYGADTTLTPEQALEQAGVFTLSDTASLYSFHRDGHFTSVPLGLSGRTLDGHWTSDGPGHYQVLAEAGWINGLAAKTYKTMDFTIYPGQFAPMPLDQQQLQAPIEHWFTGYYIINRLQDAPPPKTKE